MKLECPICGANTYEHISSDFVDDDLNNMFITQKYKCEMCCNEFDLSVVYGEPQDIHYE